MSFDIEVWRGIPSQPELLASSHGRIMVIPWRSAGEGRGTNIPYGGIPTFGQWGGTRYIYCRRGFKTMKVARLVCEAFHGPAPDDKPVCMHLDEDARNNRPENLRWGTQKENLNFPKITAYRKTPRHLRQYPHPQEPAMADHSTKVS